MWLWNRSTGISYWIYWIEPLQVGLSKHELLRNISNDSYRNMYAFVLSLFSYIQPFETPWTIAFQAPLSMGFSRQEYWSGLSCLPHGIFSTQGSNPRLLFLLHCRQILSHWATREFIIQNIIQNILFKD